MTEKKAARIARHEAVQWAVGDVLKLLSGASVTEEPRIEITNVRSQVGMSQVVMQCSTISKYDYWIRSIWHCTFGQDKHSSKQGRRIRTRSGITGKRLCCSVPSEAAPGEDSPLTCTYLARRRRDTDEQASMATHLVRFSLLFIECDESKLTVSIVLSVL